MPPITNIVGLRALAWNYEMGKFSSPTRREFIWENGIAIAKCYKCEGTLDGKEVSDIPGDTCSCGIYATFQEWTARGYTGNSEVSPIFLIQAFGKTQIPTVNFTGFRTAKAQAMAVGYQDAHYKNSETISEKLAAYQASDVLHIPVIKIDILNLMMDILNLTNEVEGYPIQTEEARSLTLEQLTEIRYTLLGE